MPRNIKIGDKFELLGMVWTVAAFSFSKTTFHAETNTYESIWLDLSKAESLDWIEEEEKLECELCHGTKVVQRKTKSTFGNLAASGACPRCSADEEKPRDLEQELFDLRKSKIIREVLELVAEAWDEHLVGDSVGSFTELLRSKAPEI